jgi:hypothetical protein
MAGRRFDGGATNVPRFDRLLPCARITSIRFKGTFSVAAESFRANTPSEVAHTAVQTGLDYAVMAGLTAPLWSKLSVTRGW